MKSDFAALVSRTRGLQPWRRVFHAATGVTLAYLPGVLGMTRGRLLVTLIAILILLVGFDLARLRVRALNTFFFRTFSVLASPREESRFASSTWYLFGVTIAYALFPPSIVIPSVLVLGFADPAASVIGRSFGTQKVGKGSVEGAVAFCVVASTVLFLTVDRSLAMLLVGAFVAMVELLPIDVDDNLLIPLATALSLTLFA